MSSDRPSEKHPWSGAITIIITIVTTGATIVARFAALEEAKDNAVEVMRDHGSRLSALERSTTYLERIHNLEMLNAEQQEKITQMGEELRELRAKRR